MIYIVQGRDITIIGDAGQQVGVMIDKYESEAATLDAAERMADFCGGTVIDVAAEAEDKVLALTEGAS